jgi:hypothetical protein
MSKRGNYIGGHTVKHISGWAGRRNKRMSRHMAEQQAQRDRERTRLAAERAVYEATQRGIQQAKPEEMTKLGHDYFDDAAERWRSRSPVCVRIRGIAAGCLSRIGSARSTRT